MKGSLVYLWALLLLVSVLGVAGTTYPCCSGAVCSASNWPGSTPYAYSGTTYCCANPSDTATWNTDSSTCSCASSTTCPTLAAIAVFPTAGCAGTASFASIVGSQAIAGYDGPCFTSSALTQPLTLACGYSSAGNLAWRLNEWLGCSASSGGGVAQVSYVLGNSGDLACLNMGVGSVVVDCSSGAATRVGTAITAPAMHTSTQLFPPNFSNGATSYPVTNVNNSVALWSDPSCESGSSQFSVAYHTTVDDYFKCLSFLSPNNMDWFRITCATNAATSTWLLTVWSASSDAGRLHFSGSGKLCQLRPEFGRWLGCLLQLQYDMWRWNADSILLQPRTVRYWSHLHWGVFSGMQHAELRRRQQQQHHWQLGIRHYRQWG
jgi:hypothetical protein